MGNSAGNALPFEIISSIEYERSDWKFHSGLRKEDKEKREEVAIFRFGKNADNNKVNWVPAQRSVQKLRTIKHPFILSYLDSLEMDDAILLVTESCLPLSAWIKTHTNNNVIVNSLSNNNDTNNNNNNQALSEVVWGLRCLLEALLFLNSTCNLTHGYIGTHAIWVCKTGDWKFGSLELACNLNNSEDRVYYKSKMNMLSAQYMAPERRQFSQLRDNDSIDDSLTNKQGAADIYSLGIVMQNIFDQMNLTPSSTVTKCLKKMTSADHRKRPTAKQALSYITDQMDLLTQLNELAIKPPAESLEILSKLSEHLNDIPVSACHHKVLPNVTKVLQMASNDFRNRDARESCRQAVQLSLTLLSSLSKSGKLEGGVFADNCLPVVMSLWTMSDRAIRTSLLKTLPVLIAHIPEASVNKQLFDPLLNGFADSNAKMREETLKNLVCVVDKLDERNLQDKLVRCIVGLQADAEAGIRTNAVIFIGRIAGKLKEGVRLRVLCTSLLKALKDSFVHCRLAGLKAGLACLQYIDMPQLAGKILPMICTLTLDRSTEVRESALNFIEAGSMLLKQNHVVMKQQMEKDRAMTAAAALAANNNNNNSGGATSSAHHGEENGNNNNASSSWSSFSWSTAVDGIAKSLEKTIVSATTDSNNNNGNDSSINNTAVAAAGITITTPPSSSSAAPVVKNTTVATVAVPNNKTTPKIITTSTTNTATAAGWDDDDDALDFIDDDDDDNNDDDNDEVYKPRIKSLALSNSNNSSGNNNSSTNKKNGWDDDPFDDDDDNSNSVFAAKPAKLIVTAVDKKSIATSSSSNITSTTPVKSSSTSNSRSSSSSINNSNSLDILDSTPPPLSSSSSSSSSFNNNKTTLVGGTAVGPKNNNGNTGAAAVAVVKSSSSVTAAMNKTSTKKPVIAAVKLAVSENEKWDDF